MTTHEARLKKLKLRAWRRGFREADLILGPFADSHIHTFSPDELDWFEALLDQPDPDIYEWILDRKPTPAQFSGKKMNELKAFRETVHQSRGHRGG
jgi:antitoxin CptB